MNIKEWAEINNFTPEQFKKEMVQFMAVISGRFDTPNPEWIERVESFIKRYEEAKF